MAEPANGPLNRAFLSSDEFDSLTVQEQRRYVVESQIDVDALREPSRSWAKGATERARVRVLRRIRVTEGPDAFQAALDAVATSEGPEVRDRLVAALDEGHRQAS